jgi:uncharacterized BrkB/YihY/UPF0761 family membrane protein
MYFVIRLAFTFGYYAIAAILFLTLAYLWGGHVSIFGTDLANFGAILTDTVWSIFSYLFSINVLVPPFVSSFFSNPASGSVSVCTHRFTLH